MGLEAPHETHQVYLPFRRLASEQVLLAVGSTDMKVCVSSAYIKGVDNNLVLFPYSWGYNTSTLVPAPTFLSEKLPLGTVCGEPTSFAEHWMCTVSFSPSGDVLAFAGEPV